MTKEQCSLQPNYYGSSCDFQDLQSAVQQLTTKSDAQFEELKNEKWFHRIFNMVVCPRKNNIRMAEQITSLAQAQGILIEILVRLADQDANIAGMVMQSQSDIRALAQNSAYLQERLYLLEDKSYGIKENENLKDLNSQQRNILSGCLNEASKLYAMPSNEQRLYANELLNYLNADAQVANLEDALDDLEDNAKRKILSCVITYMYLYDHTAESMEQDEQEDFIDLFDLGRKTIKSLKQQTVDTYRLRGVDGCIDRYITAPIEITEETPFEVELPEQKTAEGASEAQTEENGEEAIDTNATREKLVLSGSIQNDGETVYKNKDIHFSSAIMNCKGTVRFINCTIHYNEDESRIYLNSGTALEVASSTVICHGNCKSGDYFIRTVEDRVGNAVKSRTAGSCTVKNSDFVACVGFLKGSYESFLFDKNKVIGSCSDFLYLSIENKARISGSRFFLPDKPTFEVKDENNRPGDAFIHCRGKKVLFINNVFKGEKLSENSYMEEHYIYAILGSAWLSFEDEWENGMVAYCTFQQMSRCVYNIGNVRSCVFEKCREAIKECTSEISESRFEECEKAIVDVCAKAVVSNCQFIHCKGEKLLTTRGNSQVTIQDCEFSNIRWEEQEFRSYTWQSMIVIGLAEKNFANADRPSRINRCIFNGICIVPNEPGKVQKKENSAYLIAVNIENYAKFKYPRAEVTDCTFVNCAAEHAVINKEPYDSVFGSSHNYTAIRAYTRNNTGLDQIGNPATFAESQNVKRKETDAASRKIGDSLPVE